MASRHMRAGPSFREQGVLFDSWGRRARLVAVGGWQSHRAGDWQGCLEPRAPLHLARLRCNMPRPGGFHHHLSVLPPSEVESGDLDFTSAKMSVSCLFNKPHECFSSLIVTLGSDQNFKKP